MVKYYRYYLIFVCLFVYSSIKIKMCLHLTCFKSMRLCSRCVRLRALGTDALALGRTSVRSGGRCATENKFCKKKKKIKM